MKIHACCLMLFLPIMAPGQTIDRVEPPYWWIGMHRAELQILLHGEAIGSLKPETEYVGVRIDKRVAVENPNYLFIYLTIAPDTVPGTVDVKLKNKEGQVQCRFEYDLLAREEGAAQRKGYDTSDVMYLITPDRFANGNPGNDAVEGLMEKPNRKNPGGRHGGDIQGIENSLDYLANMGFTAVWLNPVLENNQ